MIEYGVANRAAPGQAASADGHLVAIRPGGVLVAAVDGVGHGPEAAVAMQTAIGTLRSNALEEVSTLLRLCHRNLRGTRGAVMSLGYFNTRDSTLTWTGVGNLVGVLFSGKSSVAEAPQFLLLRSGIVGQYLPPLNAPTIPVHRGSTLIFATDGIDRGFVQGLDLAGHPQRIADRIVSDYSLDTDDALVLVARYLGEAHGP